MWAFEICRRKILMMFNDVWMVLLSTIWRLSDQSLCGNLSVLSFSYLVFVSYGVCVIVYVLFELLYPISNVVFFLHFFYCKRQLNRLSDSMRHGNDFLHPLSFKVDLKVTVNIKSAAAGSELQSYIIIVRCCSNKEILHVHCNALNNSSKRVFKYAEMNDKKWMDGGEDISKI